MTKVSLRSIRNDRGAFPAITRSLRAIGVVSALAVATLALPAVQASAQDNGPADPGVRCAAKVGPGQYEFYLPGERATDVNGNKWVCGADGQWFRDYSALVAGGGPLNGLNGAGVKATGFKGTTLGVNSIGVAAPTAGLLAH